MFPLFFAASLVGIILVDWICLPKSARRAWVVMAFIFGVAAFLSIYQKPLASLPGLIGIGRPVDAVLYIATAVLVREFFLSRIRQRDLQSQITSLVRQIALDRAKS